MRKIVSALKFLLLLFIAFVLTIISYLLFGYVQHTILVPDDYLLWTVNFPVTLVVVIFELALIAGIFYLFHNPFRNQVKSVLLRISFVKKYRKFVIGFIVAAILLCFYSLFTAVTVITPDKIIDHSFLHPLGRDFTYEDVVKIDTKIKGKRSFIPFSYSDGEFFYAIELSNGKVINLGSVGGTGEYEHEVFVIEEIDQKLVQMGIFKHSSTENFELTTENLAKVYTDGIQRILENTDATK